MTVTRSVPVKMRNVSDKICRKKMKHILCSITFSPESRAVYEIMWENIVEPQATDDNLPHAQYVLDN
jgi:hypothetical protein